MSWNDAKWFLFASDTQNIITSQNNLVNYMYFQFDIMDLNKKVVVAANGYFHDIALKNGTDIGII